MTIDEYSDNSNQLPLLEVSSPEKKRGKLVVIEGSDGAGKATQLELLKEYLDNLCIPVRKIDFPRYHTSFYGKMIAQFLRGEYGSLDQIHPHLISVIYAMDRADAKRDMERWLRNGSIILANRYATSNMAHQSSRLPQEEHEEFLKWIVELEYGLNKIPKEDIVIYLHVPYQISQELILRKSKEQRRYVDGKKKDIVEDNLEYVRRSEEAYLELVGRFPHWVKIECMDREGNLQSREDIHEKVKKVLVGKEIIK